MLFSCGGREGTALKKLLHMKDRRFGRERRSFFVHCAIHERCGSSNCIKVSVNCIIFLDIYQKIWYDKGVRKTIRFNANRE